MVAFARPALGCAHTVGFTDVFIARDGPPQQQEMCGVQLRDSRRAKDIMLLFGMNRAYDQLAMPNSVLWYQLAIENSVL